MSDILPLGYPTLPELSDPNFRDALQRDLDDIAKALATALSTADRTAFTAPTLSGTWVDFGGGLSTVGYYKNGLGDVVLKGQAASGTAGTSIFTLPVGYRPAERRDFAAAYSGGDGGATIAVLADGTIVPTAAMGNTRISLDGIIFRAEQ